MRAHLAVVALMNGVLVSGCATGSIGRADVPQKPSTLSGATIESNDARLAAAILTEAVRPGAESSLQVAREYVRVGVLDAAYKRTARALEREPQLPAAHDMMARIWRDWGMPESALTYAHRAVYFAPQWSGAYNTLGTVLHALGKVDEAREAFVRALDLDPTAAWVSSNLCYLEFRAGNLDEARRRCEAAVRASPALAAAHNNLALTRAAGGDIDGARAAFLEAGDPASASYNMGIVYLAEGRYAEAGDAFQRAIESRPNFSAAKSRAHEARMKALLADDRRLP
jgi:tetratricopeptide (TPR) repeat protein